MVQASLPLATPSKLSLVEKLAQHFRANPYAWIDGMTLATIAGSYAWRSRCSELRRAPFNLAIENRQRKVNGVTRSEYRYLPEGLAQTA